MASKMTLRSSLRLATVAMAMACASAPAAWAIDTDIFTASNTAEAPNVLIVLDNTSNWSRNSQKFPDGNGGTITQGQAEVAAIKTVIGSLGGFINVGLLEFVTGGPAGDNGGFVRQAIVPMGAGQSTGAANKSNFSTTLTTIYNSINSPNEKTNSGQGYGNLMFDAYNYYSGKTPFASSGDVVSSIADSNGYTTSFTRFQSPLSAAKTCAYNYIIFIGNPPSSGPSPDASANTTALAAVGGDTSQLKLQQYSTSTVNVPTNLGYSSTCFTTPPTGTPANYTAQCASYSSCAYSTTDTTTTLPVCPAGSLRYSVVAVTGTTTTTLGNSFACYATAPTGTQSDYTCPAGATCTYSAPTTTGGTCPAGALYQAVGYTLTTMEVPSNPAVYATDTAPYNADEWARHMYQNGIAVAGSSINAKVATYAIDVYGVSPNATQSSLLSSMAKAGGGRYFAATNANAITTALKTIFAEIQATNSTFASAALPISATQRSQNDNQVYLGVFRADQQAFPRWFGNLKRYQLGTVNGVTDLVDVNKVAAVNPSSGFVTPCAQSYWTTDSGNYWANVNGTTVGPRVFTTTTTSPGTAWTTQGDDTNLAKGGCTNAGSAYSDLPDGPVVEKGGVAEVLRKGASRNMKTLSGKNLVDFNATNVTISTNATVNANLVKFILGQDVTGEIDGIGSTGNRPSIHGAVVHSRPLPIDYGGTIGVKVFYGSNDGTFRAIDAATGTENWSFVPPESYAYLQRLMDNTPAVQTPYPTPPNQIAAPGSAPDFYFDGSTGVYQNADNSKVWIYPTMRRGGRMLYAFDVSNPTAPNFKWKAGCPSLTSDIGCSTGLTGIGQTWSTPNVAFINGFSTSTPVLVVGGGYDTCEDADSNPSATGFCQTPKGARIYVLNGNDGSVVASFATDRSIAGDVALVDINQDGKVDAAYAADTGGNIYRINFADPLTFAPLPSTAWTITKVAYTAGSKRKFLFAPALLPYKNQVYVVLASGDREHPTAFSYPYTSPVLNRAYVYLDDPTGTVPTNLDTMSDRTATNTCSASAILPGGPDRGWYLDLNANGTGEQSVTSAIISGGLFAFSTNRPVVAAASCSNSLGEARGYFLNLLNGSGAIGATTNCGASRSTAFIGGGLPPSPVSGVVTIDGKTQNVVIGAAKLDGTASSPIGGQKRDPTISSKRNPIYWRTTTDTR